MRRIFLMLVLCLVGRPATSQTSVALREMWDQPYAGADVTAKHVSGLWSFDAADSSADDSAHQNPGKLEGAEIAADGRFGKCLRSFPGWPVEDKPHRLLVPHQASLNSAGALSLELWVNPDPAFQGYPEAFLLDKKYVAHTDYQLIVGREGQHGRRRLQAHLGFGSRSESWHSELLVLDVGTWYHIAFVYDGQGTGRFFVNGRLRRAD